MLYFFKHFTSSYRMKLKTASPAPTCASSASDHSMDRPILFKHGVKLKTASPAPTCASLTSDHSMDRPILFKHGMKLDTASTAPTCSSSASDHSMDRPILFKHGEVSPRLLTEDHFRCPLCTDLLKEPVFIPCGHSYCKTCIQSYWFKPNQTGTYSCPQCRKRFRTRPALDPNSALAKLVQKLQQTALPPHCYAGPGDVACDFCTVRKLRAVKSCLTCPASYCETHVKQHYTVAALQRHTLVEVTGGETVKQRLCKLHHKSLEVFCKTDQTFICLLCVLEEHKKHDIVTAEREDPLVQVLQNYQRDLAETHKSLKDADGSMPLLVEVAALNRPLDLGLLYDCRSDSFRPDISLWDVDTASSMRLSHPRLHTDVGILEGDSLQDKLCALDLTTALRASVVSGLVDVAGAAAFLKHPAQSQLQDRVIVHHRSSTRLDILNHRLLQSGAPLSVTSQNLATHVVVAVLYGAQAFFIVDNETESSDDIRELKATVWKMITYSDDLSNLSDLEQARCALYKCAAYIDGEDFKSSVDFKTAVELYSSLHREVPQKVWLYPLKKLKPGSACMPKDISEDLLYKAEHVLKHLDFLKRELELCKDMMASCSDIGGVTWFVALKDSLCQFALLLQQYRAAFQSRLASCIKTMREKGEEGEESLRGLLMRNNLSAFSPLNMCQWLQNKDAKVRALNECRAANITVVKSQEDLRHFIEDSQADRVLCFTLTSLEGEDPFLSALKHHIDLVNTANMQEAQPPFRLPDISRKIFSDLRSFLFTKEAEEYAGNTKYFAASAPDERFPGSSIHLYHTGRLVSDNMRIDVKPAPAQIIAVKLTRVTLRLHSSGMTFADRYRVEYKAVTCRGTSAIDAKWKAMKIYRTETNHVVLGIKPETQYQLRYAVMYANSMSDYSKITEFQTLPRARPGQPAVLKQNMNSLTVSWLSAEAEVDYPVVCYMVEYKKVDLEGWQSILTEGPKCEYTITLPYSTCYRVRVSAVYEDGETSQPSKETEVPLDAWAIDPSERKSSLVLEVLKLQTGKKPEELNGWPYEESAMRSCLPSQLRLSGVMVVRMVRALTAVRGSAPVTVKELSLLQNTTHWPQGVPGSKILTNCSVQCLNLTEAQFHIVLLCHQSSLTIRLLKYPLQKLEDEAQDEELTHCFLLRVDGDLRSSSLKLEMTLFLQPYAVTVKQHHKAQSFPSPGEESEECESVPVMTSSLSQRGSLRGQAGSAGRKDAGRRMVGTPTPLSVNLEPVDTELLRSRLVSTGGPSSVPRNPDALVFTRSTKTQERRWAAQRPVQLEILPALKRYQDRNQPEFIHRQNRERLMDAGWRPPSSSSAGIERTDPFLERRLSGVMVVRMVRALTAVRGSAPVTVKELSLLQNTTHWPQGVPGSKILTNCSVQCLNLTEAQFHIVLLCHQSSLTIRLLNYPLQKLEDEAQDEALTHCFLLRVDGDLRSFSLKLEMTLFLQPYAVTVKQHHKAQS
ncbi:hypothetical protein NFI96_025945, partial [Prochilodus magdalenae]